MHLKRQKVPKNWPVYRKGTKYVVRPNFNLKQGVPILVILRDMLKIAQNRKEVKKAIHRKHLLLNSQPVRDEKNSATLFDVLTLIPSKKNYRITLSEKGKFAAEEIKDAGSDKKVSKIINKKILKGKKIQLNLSDGRNVLSDIKCNVNDSVLVNLKDKKIEKCLPLKEKTSVMVLGGKHAGETGVIEKIEKERKMVGLNVDKKKINVLIKQLIVIE